jgi:L-lactate dehydrogenase complex protein LldG
MATARDEILQRIQAATRDVAQRKPTAIAERLYHTSSNANIPDLLERFAERVTEYKARVHVVAQGVLAGTITSILQERGTRRLVVPADLPAEWLPATGEVLHDTGNLSYAELEACDGVVTGCVLGVAQTGTIVLDHSAAQGRRVISLLPDYHLCIIRTNQIVDLMPEAIERLAGSVTSRRPVTFISGPSATSDIELNRVEGVHGPRTLEVIVVL